MRKSFLREITTKGPGFPYYERTVTRGPVRPRRRSIVKANAASVLGSAGRPSRLGATEPVLRNARLVPLRLEFRSGSGRESGHLRAARGVSFAASPHLPDVRLSRCGPPLRDPL